MSFSILPSVNVALIDSNKVLHSRRKNTGWMDGHFCLPGGHVEEGETPRQACVREIKEELGIDVMIDDLEYVCTAVRNTKPNQYVAYEFLLRDKGFTVTNAEPDKCSELVWVAMDSLPSDVIKDFAIVVQEGVINHKSYLEIGF